MSLERRDLHFLLPQHPLKLTNPVLVLLLLLSDSKRLRTILQERLLPLRRRSWMDIEGSGHISTPSTTAN